MNLIFFSTQRMYLEYSIRCIFSMITRSYKIFMYKFCISKPILESKSHTIIERSAMMTNWGIQNHHPPRTGSYQETKKFDKAPSNEMTFN